jgi:hypothetical protein
MPWNHSHGDSIGIAAGNDPQSVSLGIIHDF